MLGSPYTPEHPPGRRLAYAGISVLTGITAGLGNALITANLAYVQGSLGLYSNEAALLTVAYVGANVCSNLVLLKFRQQFGLGLFARSTLFIYALATLAHLFAHDLGTALLVRAISGIAASGLTAICLMSCMQAFSAPKRMAGAMLGISLPQLATPLARIIAPDLLAWGDWRMAYWVELAFALASLAAVLALPLPPSDRNQAFSKADWPSIALLFPGVGLLCTVLGLGRILWWTASPALAAYSVGAVLLIGTAVLIERRRREPLLQLAWLRRREILRIAAAATVVRILTAEQSFGAVGLLTAVGMGVDQLRGLYAVVLLASVAGMFAALATLSPTRPGRPITLACLCIGVGAFMDAGASALTRPAELYLSQSLIGFGTLLFVGPVMLIGVSRVMLAGPKYMLTWVILFGATQNIGGMVGSAAFGTYQIVRERAHSSDITARMSMVDPFVEQRLLVTSKALGGTIGDPGLRRAEATSLLGREATRQANVMAYNDVFRLIGSGALIAFVLGILIQLGARRRGEQSPLVAAAEAARATEQRHEVATA